MQQQQLPNDERREELRGLVNNLQTAQDHISPHDEAASDSVSNMLENADSQLSQAIHAAEDELDKLPKWDGELVRDLVLDHADRRDTVTERVDGEVVLRFEVGDIGDETECRYAVGVTSGNEWFHVRRDGDWDEVWRN